MEQFLNTETLVIELLLVASLVAIATQKIGLPYTVTLVVVGFFITLQQPSKIVLTPELILVIFLPPLIFEAAFHIELRSLKELLGPLGVLAVPGVILTAVLVGLVVAVGANLSLTSALVFGALISATDPVAVVALFRSLGAPKKLTLIVEGESLLNDGTAIVLFNLVLGLALPSLGSTPGNLNSFDIFSAIIEFIRVSLIGTGIGAALGWVISQIMVRIDDYLVETTLTTVLAYGSYLAAERLHSSGVLAVVATGIICGYTGTKGMSPTTRIVLYNFWEYLAFIANSLVFLLIGLDIELGKISSQLGIIAIAILGVILSRLVVVYGFSWLLNFRKAQISLAYQHVLVWGGLRGAVGLALVLSLPLNFPDRDLLRVMAYGVVLFTLLVQGTTMRPLLKQLKLIGKAGPELEYERRHGRLMALEAANRHLEQLFRAGLVSKETWNQTSSDIKRRLLKLTGERQQLLQAHPDLQAGEQIVVVKEGLRAQRAMLLTLLSSGVISEEVYAELVGEVDKEIQRQEPESSPKPI